jgi:predicted MPP superfamily phosphohydrolase
LFFSQETLISEEINNIRNEFKFLKKIKAPFGKFGVLGNRELDYNSVKDCNKIYSDVGIKILNNEIQELIKDGIKFNILGVLETTNSGLKALRKNKKPTIMITHQPKSALLIKKYKLEASLMLCGHTHCGQIMPFGKKILNRQNQPFIKGINTYGNTIVYVSCGAGHTLLPFRLFTKSEIALITINPIR